MGRVSKLLENSVVELAEAKLKDVGKNALLARKLQAVISAKKHGITKVAEVYDISRTTLTSWIKHLRSGKLEKLQAPPERRKKTILNDGHRDTIRSWVNENSQLTIDMIKMKLEENFGIRIGRSTVHREMRKLGLSYITPRPRHFKQDKNQVSEFKKKYNPKN